LKSNSTLTKNIIYLFIVQGSAYILPLITFPYLVRILGAEFFGILGFCQASMQYFVLLTDYGFNWTATQAIAKNKDNKSKINEIFWSVFWAKLLLTLISVIVLILVTLSIAKYRDYANVMIAFFPLVIGNLLFPIWLFQGMEKMKTITIATLIARALIVPLTFIFVQVPQDVWIAALIQSSVNVIAGLISLYFIYREGWIGKVEFNLLSIKSCLRDGWHVFISTSAISLYTTSTTVILGFLSGPIAVGYFNTANTIRNAAQGLLNPVSQAVYPRINAIFNSDYQGALRLIRKLIIYLGGLAFLGSLTMFIIAPVLIEYGAGPGYEPAIDILRIMAFLPFIIILSNIFGVQTMLTHNFKKQFSTILIASGVLNLAIIFPLVMFLQQDGAAISVLITEIFVTSSMYLFLSKKNIHVIKLR
jgi:O-antigen flippase